MNMVDPQDFTVEFSESSGDQVVSTKTKYDGQGVELLYARPKGRDTWFNFIGNGRSITGVSSPVEIPNEVREASDEAVLNKGYPIRTVNGKQSKKGSINLFFGGVHHVHPFVTSPCDFYVFQDDSFARPEGGPDSNEVYIRIIEEENDEVTVEVESGNTQPADFVIKEAILFRYGSTQGWQNQPQVDIKS